MALQHIRAAMTERGVTQRDVADVAGTVQPSVSYQLAGIRPMTVQVARAISELTGLRLGSTAFDGLRLADPSHVAAQRRAKARRVMLG